MNKVIIHSSEVALLLDVNIRTARRVLAKVRKHFGKGIYDPVSIGQFCEYIGIPEEEVKRAADLVKK